MARVLFDTGINGIVTPSGGVGVGWQVAFYTAGTTTQITTWNAETGGSANTNPVVTDGNGRIGEVWIDDGQSVKWVLSDNNGVVQETRDNVPLGSIPSAPDASLDSFLTAASPLPIANGGTNATSTTNALTNLGAVPAAGGTVTGNITRSGKGAHAYFHDAAMVNPEIFIAPTGGTDPRAGLPGQIWLRY